MRGEKFSAGDYDGCSFAPSCLNCPFAKCRYDYFGEGYALRAGRRDVVAEMARDGYSAEQIVEALPGAGDIDIVRGWMVAE